MKKILALIALVILPVMLFAQTTGEITGVVTDENGNPLAGVNVIVEGTRYGAATDMNGEYKVIGVPAGVYAVRAEYIGMESQTVQNVQVAPGATATANFELTESVLEGKEIVYIGYGVQEKKDLTGAATSVRVKDIQKVATTQASTALQGRAAGVNVSQTSGAPGSSAEIKIRGAGTLSGTSPLIIVDGVPSTMSELGYINPEDIESLDVLKDASAAAIYGSRAGNGVILVTTKRGDKGPVRIHFNSTFSVNSVSEKFPLIDNASDYIKVAKEMTDNAGEDYEQFITMYDADPTQFGSTDWQDAYFTKGYRQQYELAISGGSENTNFSVSGAYAKEEGIVSSTDDERMSLRINSDFTKGKLKIGESFSVGRHIWTDRWNESYSFFHLNAMTPLTPVHDDENPTGFGGQDFTIGLAKEANNPIARMALNDNRNDYIRMMISGYLEYTPVKDLKYTMRLSQNIANNYDFDFEPQYYLSENDQQAKTSMWETRYRRYHTVMDHTLNYDLTLGKHNMNALAGYSQEKSDSRSTYGYAEKFSDTSLQVLDAGQEGDDAGGLEYTWRYRSYFGRLNYDYDGKYLFQVNVRRDGSSRFDEESRWGTFPSISAGWRLSEESFFSLPYVTDLKIRGSYGELGMQEFDEYLYIPTIASDQNEDLNYPFGEGRHQPIYVGMRSTSFPSIGLKWESMKQTNIGFDLGLMEDRVRLEFDYYMKENADILYDAPIPISAGVGYNFPTVNAASVDNKGIEITANFREAVKPLKYDINMTLTTYSNEVTYLGGAEAEFIGAGGIYWALDNTTRTLVGRPIASFYLYKTDGIFNTQSELDTYNQSVTRYMDGKTPQLGDVKYVDVNGDGEIDSNDRKFFGSAQPDAELGLNVNLSYKNFDFNMFWYTVLGKQMINGAKWLSYRTDEYHNFHEDYLDAWSEDNPNSDIPRAIYGDDRNTQASDLFLEDADYLRLRHVELGYTVPASMLGSTGIGSLRIFVAAENLLTFTKYTGYDPAIDYGTLFSRGADRSPYPIPRQIITGVQIGL